MSDARRIVVMDAGFYSASNVKWLTDHGFNYITVEETFHILKTDLDIRLVYHKSDGGIKAHLTDEGKRSVP